MIGREKIGGGGGKKKFVEVERGVLLSLGKGWKSRFKTQPRTIEQKIGGDPEGGRNAWGDGLKFRNLGRHADHHRRTFLRGKRKRKGGGGMSEVAGSTTGKKLEKRKRYFFVRQAWFRVKYVGVFSGGVSEKGAPQKGGTARKNPLQTG